MRLESRPRRLALLGASLLAALLALGPLGAGAVAAASTDYVSKCSVNLRADASTGASVVDTIASGTLVTATGTVEGTAWSADCSGTVSGTSWYVITAVSGTSTQTKYGAATVYAATGLFSLAPAPPPPSNWLEGIDVSHWQGAINWATVAKYKAFAILKATESTTYADDTYVYNHANARANGIRTGGYHFAQPSTTAGDAVAEADWLVAHLNLQVGDLPPALDLERSNGLSVSAMQAWVKAWLNEVYAKTGVRPMIYTSPSFWRTYLGDTRMFADLGYTTLWIAHWGVTSPSVPGSNWGGKGWTFWQYSSNTPVPGISGNVDHDRFNGLDLTRVTYGADFKVSHAPASQSVEQGAGTSFAVSIDRTYFTLPVNLTVSGAPAGATVSLDKATTSGNGVTLSVTTSSTGTVTPVGSYPLTVTATSNGLTRTATPTLVVTDGLGPVLTAPASRMFAGSELGPGGLPGRTSWSGTDPSGVAGYELQAQVNGGAWTTVGPSPATTASFTESWTLNDTHRYRVRATDGAANTSAFKYGPTYKAIFTQDTSSTVHYSSGWTTSTPSLASGGTLHHTGTAGAWASFSFTGAGIAWVSYKGPTRGSARVYIDGAYLQTVSLYSASYVSKVVVFAKAWTSNGVHTIRIVNLATAGRPRIDLDAFARIVLL